MDKKYNVDINSTWNYSHSAINYLWIGFVIVLLLQALKYVN